jgi:hypothetical protein
MCIPHLLHEDLRDRDCDSPEVQRAEVAEVISALIHPVPEEMATAEEVLCNG